MGEFTRQLEARHCVPVAFSVSEQEIKLAADRFLKFLSLPDSIKRQLHFPARVERASADGYTDKSDLNTKDPKQFFHWNPNLLVQPHCRELVEGHNEISNFFDSAAYLYGKIAEALYNVFNNHLPDYLHHLYDGKVLRDGTLRFLSYSPRSSHSFCAKAHFDKGFSTLAIGDSAPGLRIGCCDNHLLTEIFHQPGQALFMPGWMLYQASDGAIKPAWHDVVHSPGVQDVSPDCARWSIVFFTNCPSLNFSSWDELHRPLH
ncbi:MAG: hypothetical protein ACI8P9_001976 [Parasphingorhabdus sp.]|jgi:hypothetical protein